MKQIKFLLFVTILIIAFIQLHSCKPGNDEESQNARTNKVSKDTQTNDIPKDAQSDEDSKEKWTECPLTCDWTEGKVVFLRKHVHPIMAEYDRKIRLDIAGQNSVYCLLPSNVGGRTLINVYWIDEKDDSGPMLLMRDRWGEYLVDLKNKKTNMLRKSESNQVFYDRSEYIGRIDGRKPDLFFIPSSDSKEETIEMIQY